MKSKKYFRFCLFAVCLMFWGVISSAHAEVAPTAAQTAAINQAVSSGQLSQQQVQQGMQLLESGQISGATIEQLKQKSEMGSLTPEDIQAGKQMLEQASENANDQTTPDTEKEDVVPEEEQDNRQKGHVRRSEPEIFGHNLFARPPSTFAPIKDMPVSSDYIIGPGDEINILMWGRIDATYNLVVDKEGVIQFPKIGPLSVAGQTFSELKELIHQKAEAITGVNVNVSMGRLRSIQVFVLGEVKAPGVYTVSSLATVTNALLASGGPTRLGSLRDVQLKRNSHYKSKIDFYNFLMKGDTSADTRLMPGDVIFVPQAGPMINVSGNVKRPMIYELKDKVTLQNALEMAGGLSPRAFNQRIQIERAFENRVQIVVDISYEALQKKTPILLQDGDVVRVSGILADPVNAVFLYGNVLRPGNYAYKENLRVLDIIQSIEDLQMDTYLPYALIKRYQLNSMDYKLIPFNLGRLLIDQDMAQNLALMPLDEIYVFHKSEFKDKEYAQIEGRVRKPGKYNIEKMTIRDLIFMAGQLERDAYMKLGHLYRTNPITKDATIHSFNVGKAMANDPAENLSLQDLDRVIIHSIFDYNEKYNVSVTGRVNNPGDYPFAENMTIKDLIAVAGSTEDDAYLDEAELVRYHILDGKSVETTILKFNLKLAMTGDPGHNLELYPMDVINVKQVPEWQDKKRSVTLSGEFVFPGTYQIRKDERLVDIINRAGGFTDMAYLKGAVFTRESVRIMQQQRIDELANMMEAEIYRMSSKEVQSALSTEDIQAQSQFIASQEGVLEKLKKSHASGRVTINLSALEALETSRFDMILEDGDKLYVPQTPSTVNVLGSVYNPNAHVFDVGYPEMKYYLARSGGPTKNADEREIYIIRADGTVISKNGGSLLGVSWDEHHKRWGFWNKFENTELYPGDTILVPERIIKPDFMKNMKDVTQILYQIAVTAGITITQVF